jgi:hypothetical protein
MASAGALASKKCECEALLQKDKVPSRAECYCKASFSCTSATSVPIQLYLVNQVNRMVLDG